MLDTNDAFLDRRGGSVTRRHDDSTLADTNTTREEFAQTQYALFPHLPQSLQSADPSHLYPAMAVTQVRYTVYTRTRLMHEQVTSRSKMIWDD